MVRFVVVSDPTTEPIRANWVRSFGPDRFNRYLMIYFEEVIEHSMRIDLWSGRFAA